MSITRELIEKKYKIGDFVHVIDVNGQRNFGSIVSIYDEGILLDVTNYLYRKRKIVYYEKLYYIRKVKKKDYPNGPIGTIKKINFRKLDGLTDNNTYIVEKMDNDNYYLLNDEKEIKPYMSDTYWKPESDPYNYITDNLKYPIGLLKYIGKENDNFIKDTFYEIYNINKNYVTIKTELGDRRNYKLDSLKLFELPTDENVFICDDLLDYYEKNEIKNL